MRKNFYGYVFYASKYLFLYKKKILIDTHGKIWTEITDIVVFRKKLLKFLQGDEASKASNAMSHCKITPVGKYFMWALKIYSQRTTAMRGTAEAHSLINRMQFP